MWNSCASFDRVKKAMKYRGLNPKRLDLDALARVFMKRGITDRQQNEIVHRVLAVLEPTPCWVSHCKSYGGSTAFCNCGAGLIPGKCKIRRDYTKRKKDRAVKAVDELIVMLNNHFKTNDSLAEINPQLDYWKFFDHIEKMKVFSPMRAKWRPIHDLMWKEIMNRKKAARAESQTATEEESI